MIYDIVRYFKFGTTHHKVIFAHLIYILRPHYLEKRENHILKYLKTDYNAAQCSCQ